MKIAVIRFPGTNNEYETKRVLESFNVQASIIEHYEYDQTVNYDGIWLAGGFAYGDVLRAGAIASKSDMIDTIKTLNKPVLGTCNGFQILTESKILPGALIPNTSTRFICKWVNLYIPENDSYLSDIAGNILKLPIAHFEGNLWSDNPLELEKTAIAYYSNDNGEKLDSCNPNGSIQNIAGLSSKNGNIVGMMPHPERASFKHQGSIDGRKIIQSFINEVKR